MPATALRKGSRAAPRPFQREANLSQWNSNPPSAFPKGSGPASGLFNETQTHNRPSQRKQATPRPFQRNANPQPPFAKGAGPRHGLFNGTQTFPNGIQTRPRPSQWEAGPHPAFSTERKPTTALLKGNRPRLGLPKGKQIRPSRPSQWEAGPHPAFSTEHKPTTGLLKGNRPRLGLPKGKQIRPSRPSQWEASPQSALPKGKHAGRTCTFAKGTQAAAPAFPTGSKPGPFGLPSGIRARPRPSQREAGPPLAFSKERKPTTALLKGNRPRLGLPKGKQIRPSRPSQWEAGPHPAFSKERKPTTALLKGNGLRHGLRIEKRAHRKASPPSAFPTGSKPFPTEYGPAPAFAQGKGRLRAGPFPFHSSAATKPPLRSER